MGRTSESTDDILTGEGGWMDGWMDGDGGYGEWRGEERREGGGVLGMGSFRVKSITGHGYTLLSTDRLGSPISRVTKYDVKPVCLQVLQYLRFRRRRETIENKLAGNYRRRKGGAVQLCLTSLARLTVTNYISYF